jgi:prepilin signal peptidase PulO-like enzyme (type II secretory pathway)
MPFGPYLAGAGLLTLFFGDSLLNQYLSMVAL